MRFPFEMTALLLFPISCMIAALGTRLSIALAKRHNMLDQPNARSAHTEAVPRMGGAGILLGFTISLWICWIWSQATGDAMFSGIPEAVLWGMVGFAVIGFLDDVWVLSPFAKYGMQLPVVVLLIANGILIRETVLPVGGRIALGIVAIPASVLWLTGYPNFFNFMDGINGMAAGAAIIHGCFLSLFAYREGRADFAIFGILLAGSACGFIVFNFPGAKTFMGDTGSLFLGMGTAALPVLLWNSSRNNRMFIALLMLVSVFLYDCSFTIIRRLLRRENIFHAHRSHHYQRLIHLGWNHTSVASLYFFLHLMAGISALVYLRAAPWQGRTALLCVFCLLGGLTGLVKWQERRRAQEPGETGLMFFVRPAPTGDEMQDTCLAVEKGLAVAALHEPDCETERMAQEGAPKVRAAAGQKSA